MRSHKSPTLWRVCLILLLFITQFATFEAAKEEISELRRRAIKAYAQIAPCLTSAWIYQAKYGNSTSTSSKKGQTKHTFSFPEDADAEAHFRSVKSTLERFHHTARMHTYRHYSGPWIENHFISHFKGKSLLDMHGIIPLLIPWVDNQRTGEVLWGDIFRTLKQLLRPNMIYLAVSQGDIGLAKIGEYFPNILVLSGGGFGHVPVPLIKGELPYREITKWPFPFDQEIGFFGNLHQASRPIMFEIIRREADREGMTHKIAFGECLKCSLSLFVVIFCWYCSVFLLYFMCFSCVFIIHLLFFFRLALTLSLICFYLFLFDNVGPTWMDMMAKSKFNLAPRGFGRSSFRFVE